VLLGPRCPFLQNPEVVCEGLAGAWDLAQLLDRGRADRTRRLVPGPIADGSHDRMASWRGRCSIQTGSTAPLSLTPSHPAGRPMRAAGSYVHRQTSAAARDPRLAQGDPRANAVSGERLAWLCERRRAAGGTPCSGRKGPAGGRGSRSQGDEREIRARSFCALREGRSGQIRPEAAGPPRRPIGAAP
jgi:hypothetical protein